MLHKGGVSLAVNLGTKRVHRRTFAEIEHSALKGGFVGGTAHFSAKGIYLSNKMALCRSPDRGIAGHIANRIEIYAEHHRFFAKAGRRQRRFNAGVPCPDNGNVEIACKIIHILPTFQRRICGRPRLQPHL